MMHRYQDDNHDLSTFNRLNFLKFQLDKMYGKL